MSALKRYRVSVVTWDVFDYWIDAPDTDEAEELARDAWFDGDRTDFKHRHGELDHVEAEEIEP